MMDQIKDQEGRFVLSVKKNHPEAYAEIVGAIGTTKIKNDLGSPVFEFLKGYDLNYGHVSGHKNRK